MLLKIKKSGELKKRLVLKSKPVERSSFIKEFDNCFQTYISNRKSSGISYNRDMALDFFYKGFQYAKTEKE